MKSASLDMRSELETRRERYRRSQEAVVNARRVAAFSFRRNRGAKKRTTTLGKEWTSTDALTFIDSLAATFLRWTAVREDASLRRHMLVRSWAKERVRNEVLTKPEPNPAGRR